MVEIINAEVFGLERSQRAIGNSFNVGEIDTTTGDVNGKLASNLGSNMAPHQSHDAYLKGIQVMFDIRGNGVFMPEFQRYHHMEIIMSQSTMHSLDKLINGDFNPFTKYVSDETKAQIKRLYNEWVAAREDRKSKKEIYEAFERLVHNVPRGLELWATVSTNYLQLKTIVIQRAHHKNVEDWGGFVKFCYELPQFRELCGFNTPEWELDKIFPLLKEL